MARWRERNNNNSNDINLFSDKRPATHRQRRSIVSIDDVDHLMEVRSAHRRSIMLLMNDDIGTSSHSNDNNNTGAFWNKVSPENLQNLLKKNSTVEETVLKSPVPKLALGKKEHNSQTVTTADESYPSGLSSSTSMTSSQSSQSSSTSSYGTLPLPKNRIPLWCNRLNAISRWEHRQEQAYHDTLDKRQKAKEQQQQQQQQQQHNQWGRYWPGRKQSIRDGLDFSRDVHLASGDESIRAFADSFTELLAIDDDLNNKNDVKDDENNNNTNHHNGYLQDTRPSSSPKTQKCVLDLIA